MENDELLKSVTEKAQVWLGAGYDEETRAEVQRMLDADDKTELIECFYRDLEFGTGGLRGIMGAGCNRMNKYTVASATQGLANYLKEALKGTEDKLILPEPCKNSQPSWFGFLISVREDSGLDRNQVTRYIESHNIQTRLLFSGNLIKHPCFDEMRKTGTGYRVVGDLSVTDTIMRDTFWVGVYPGMTDEMIDYMARTIIDAVRSIG